MEVTLSRIVPLFGAIAANQAENTSSDEEESDSLKTTGISSLFSEVLRNYITLPGRTLIDERAKRNGQFSLIGKN